jgi:hypothetical protein
MLANIGHNMGYQPRLLPNADCSKRTIWQTILREKFTMAAWLIWKERNAFIFQNSEYQPLTTKLEDSLYSSFLT